VYQQLTAILRELSVYGLADDDALVGMTAAEIVASTGDPYAAYFTKEEYEAYSADLNGNFVGIGVTVDRYLDTTLGETVRVLCVFEGSPAQAAGLEAGDLITTVGDVAVADVGYVSAVSAVTGESGTSVTLTYYRAGEAHTVAATRAACVKQTVFSYLLTPSEGTSIGYVRVTTFDAVTTSQFCEAVDALEAAGVDGFVFDLRYNGGGYLRTVCEMLAYLLPDGNICTVDYHSDLLSDSIVYSAGDTLYMQDGVTYTTDALGNPLNISHALTVPCAVLTNGSTASAAELFTSALRDYAADEAVSFPTVTIVGTNTYGKGCMQSTYRLADGSYVKLTVALYNPPCGTNYDGVGIAPTIVVENTVSSSSLYLDPTGADPVREAAVLALTGQTS
jgi:carboxyl-terminal processing protease